MVQEILREHLPLDALVWVFGSRANGRVHRGSDLDLAIEAGRRLSGSEALNLEYAFEESDLPYKVDVVDLHSVSDSFRQIVAATRISLDYRPQNMANDLSLVLDSQPT